MFVGQGTIEYLVVIAVVVVIGLVVVGLLTTMANTDSASFTSIKVAQKIGKNGISVIDSVESNNGDSILVLKNVDSEPYTITKISSIVNNAEINPSVYDKQVPSQGQVAFSISDLNLACPCNEGDTRKKCTYKITALYSSGLTNTATIDVVTECSGNAIPSGGIDVAGLGDGTLNNPWVINSCKELQDVSQRVDGNYVLEADINCYETINWNAGAGFDPIGADYQFTGTFDGRGHKIFGLYIYRPSEQMIGLFQQPSRAIIKNVGLEDGTITGNTYVGGIAGVLTTSTLVQNVYNKNKIYATSWYAGGIVGYMQASSIITDSFNAGDVNVGYGMNRWYGGGIASFVQQSTIQNCYNVGSISGEDKVAGITSAVFMATAKNSFSTGKIFGFSTSTNGTIAVNIAGTINNIWWYDQAGDNAIACGTTCSISTTDTNFYSKNQTVYNGTPVWDFTNTWQENASDFPTFK